MKRFLYQWGWIELCCVVARERYSLTIGILMPGEVWMVETENDQMRKWLPVVRRNSRLGQNNECDRISVLLPNPQGRLSNPYGFTWSHCETIMQIMRVDFMKNCESIRHQPVKQNRHKILFWWFGWNFCSPLVVTNPCTKFSKFVVWMRVKLRREPNTLELLIGSSGGKHTSLQL